MEVILHLLWGDPPLPDISQARLKWAEREPNLIFSKNWTSPHGWKALFNINSIALGILVVEILIVLYSVIKIKCVGQI